MLGTTVYTTALLLSDVHTPAATSLGTILTVTVEVMVVVVVMMMVLAVGVVDNTCTVVGSSLTTCIQ